MEKKWYVCYATSGSLRDSYEEAELEAKFDSKDSREGVYVLEAVAFVKPNPPDVVVEKFS